VTICECTILLCCAPKKRIWQNDISGNKLGVQNQSSSPTMQLYVQVSRNSNSRNSLYNEKGWWWKKLRHK
jgi:hypothetical protein